VTTNPAVPAPSFLSRYRSLLLAALSGVLLALSFPLPGLSFLAWVALIPLLAVCRGASPREAGRWGFVTGIIAFGGIVYWVNIVMTTYGRLPLPVSLVLYLLLTAYLALYPAAFAWLVARGAAVRIPVVVAAPVAWTALEFLRAHLLTGFPWACLGHSQYRILPLIQVADLTGVYGLSFLLVIANVVLWGVVRSTLEQGPFPLRGMLVLFLVVGGVVGYGGLKLTSSGEGEPLRVALLQGNIPQDVKWDPAFQESTIAIYERLTREAAAGGARLVVWPESAAPFYLQDDRLRAERIQSLARNLKAAMVVGSPAYEMGAGTVRYFNSAFLVDDGGAIAGRSDKVHLVPFGEYVPLGRLFPFVSKMVVGIGDFSPGRGTIPLAGGPTPLGVLICFEGIFPEIGRGYVAAGARLLVSITNDAWFGRSSAPHQHLAMTVFRAVENRVPLVRAANTGISAIIDSRGHIRGMTTLFTEGQLGGEVRISNEGSFYTRHGDLFAITCLAALLAGGLFAWRAERRAGKDRTCSEKNLHA
jgi:apolipoprotein N-acyltransferase